MSEAFVLMRTKRGKCVPNSNVAIQLKRLKETLSPTLKIASESTKGAL